MSFDAKHLYELLPAIYRLRDADQGEPLRALLAVVADQLALLEQDLEQLHDDQFVETAAPWVLPYIADSIALKGVGGGGSALGDLARAEVGNTIGYRRRKGTAAMLEQLARDITGFPARVVEFFELLATTRFLNHARPDNLSVLDLHDASRLAWLGSPFERLAGFSDLAHVADVRRIDTGRGRYNIPSVGVFLWRIRAFSLTRSPAVPDGGSRHFRFGSLGQDLALFNRPQTETEFTHLAEPVNVPMRISRGMLLRDLPLYYGPDRSLSLWEPDGAGGFVAIGAERIDVCDLSAWHEPAVNRVAIDPELGRIAFPEDRDAIEVTFQRGFSAAIGGGEYDRLDPRDAPAPDPRSVPSEFAALALALSSLSPPPAGSGSGGVIEIGDSGRYLEVPHVDVRLPDPSAAGGSLVIRAANQRAPTLVLGDAAAPGTWTIGGDDGAEVIIDGLLIGGGSLRVPATINGRDNRLRRLVLRHCTLVPGLGAVTDGAFVALSPVSLTVEISELELVIEHCIVGGLRVHERSSVRIADSIIDAGADDASAFASPGGAAGGTFTAADSTIIGRVHAVAIELAENSLFVARRPLLAGPDDPRALHAERQQIGCMRFSHVPLTSRAPRRFECHPLGGVSPAADAMEALRSYPVFESLRYGDPEYAQLSALTAVEIRTGADDEAEMGVFHDLRQARKEAHLRGRLAEYLPFGLEVGIFYTS